MTSISDPPGAPVERFINVQARLDNGVLLSITAGDTNMTGGVGSGVLRTNGIGLPVKSLGLEEVELLRFIWHMATVAQTFGSLELFL